MTLPRTPEAITAAWLSTALERTVDGVTIEDVIPGAASKVRVRLDDGDTVIVKAPMAGAPMDADTLSFFAGEVAFYRDVAPRLAVGAPRCLFAAQDEGQALVILEDLSDARFYRAGDTIGTGEAAAVLDVLAQLHAATWDQVEAAPVYPAAMRGVLTGMLSGRYWAGCLARPRSASIPPALREPDALRRAIEVLWEDDAPDARCIVHGDAHLGNAYVAGDGAVGLLDWQMSCRGHPCHDVAYFVASALDPAERAAAERALLEGYLAALAEHGGPILVFEDAWRSYRRHMIHGLYWATNADGMYPEAINARMVARFSRAIEEL